MNVQDTYSKMQELELVAALQRGEKAAFRPLYEKYRGRVYNLIYYSLGDALLVEDILQSVFIKIYCALPGFRSESSLATWIYSITLNECRNHRRSRSENYVPLESILGSGEDLDVGQSPDEQQVYNERRE